MRHFKISFILCLMGLWLSACGSQRYLEPSEAIWESPKKYVGQTVKIKGYLRDTYGNVTLFRDRNSYVLGPALAPHTAQLLDILMKEQGMPQCDKHYVIVEAKFTEYIEDLLVLDPVRIQKINMVPPIDADNIYDAWPVADDDFIDCYKKK